MIVMGVESSCDETGVGIVRWNGDGTCELLADEVASSVDQHARYGGVVPEVASRAHLEAIVPTMRRALAAAGIEKPDALAVTIGPGLAGALLVGVAAAKAYAAAWNIPFYAVNHLGGHVSVDTLEHGPLPSCVALLVSGGHTHLLHVEDLGKPIVELGTTVDDAAGEAFDKVARLLGLGFPRWTGTRCCCARGRSERNRLPSRHDGAARFAARLLVLGTQDVRRALCRIERARRRDLFDPGHRCLVPGSGCRRPDDEGSACSQGCRC